MVHLVYISGIAFLLYVAFITFFRDFAKRQWEKGRIYFMPEDLRSFVIVYKVTVIIMLLILIYGYVSFLLGIPITPS